MTNKFIMNNINNNSIKSKIIDYIYSKINLMNYRYIILNTVKKLLFLKNNIHYMSPNYKGKNYLLIINIINNIKYCVLLERKQLSYHKNKIKINKLKFYLISNDIIIKNNSSDTINELYNGTIIDGKLLYHNNKNIFLIQDCYYLMGNNLTNMKMNLKLDLLDSVIKSHFKYNDQENFINFPDYLNINEYNDEKLIFKLNKLYNYDDLINIINKINTNYKIVSGLIFYPYFSGINIIYIDKNNLINNNNDNDNDNNNDTDNDNDNDNDNTIISNDIINNTDNYDTINIMDNYVDFLKTKKYSYELNNKQKILWLDKSLIPDVYNISETVNGPRLGIALIPNLKISYLCDNLIIDKPKKFLCVFYDKFNKWIPIKHIPN